MSSATVTGSCLAFLSALLVCSLGLAEPQGKGKDAPTKSKIDPDKQDNLKGRARWEWILGEGKKAETGTFMGYVTGEVFHSKKQIGTFTIEAKKQVKVDFTAGPLKGKADLHMTKPGRFEGELVRKGGVKEKLVLVIYND